MPLFGPGCNIHHAWVNLETHTYYACWAEGDGSEENPFKGKLMFCMGSQHEYFTNYLADKYVANDAEILFYLKVSGSYQTWYCNEEWGITIDGVDYDDYRQYYNVASGTFDGNHSGWYPFDNTLNSGSSFGFYLVDVAPPYPDLDFLSDPVTDGRISYV